MKKLPHLTVALVLTACMSSPGSSYVFFPELATEVHAGDPAALEKVLTLADSTLPGAQLEELAQLASHYVRRSPVAFLRAQAPRAGCFGVDFMGDDYVDDSPARNRERTLRRAALEKVNEQDLAGVKARCLAELDVR